MIVFVVLTLALGSAPAHGLPEELAPDLLRVVEHVTAQQEVLAVLAVESEYRTEVPGEASGSWAFGGRVAVSTAFESRNGGRWWIDFHPEESPWTNGKEERAVDEYTAVYDGRLSFENHRATGGASRVTPIKRGKVLADPSPAISHTAPYASGWVFSVLGARGREGSSLPQMLASARFEVSLLSKPGAERIEVQCLHRRSEERLILEFEAQPLRLRRIERVHHELCTVQEIEEAVEVLPGFWYPTRAHGLKERDGVADLRYWYAASEVRVVDLEAEDPFHIEWPEGVGMVDTALNTTFKTAPSDTELAESLFALADEAHRNVAAGPPVRATSAAPTIDGVTEEATFPAAESPLFTGSSLPLVLFGAILLVLGLRRRAVAVLVAGLALASPLEAQLRSVAGPELGERKMMHHPLNASAFTLAYLGEERPLTEVAEILETGEWNEQDRSLADLDRAFGDFGLDATRWVALPLSEALARWQEGSCLIFCHGEDRETQRECAVLCERRGDFCYVVEPPHNVGWLSTEDFLDRYESTFDREALLVRREREPERPLVALSEEKLSIDLGDVRQRRGSILAPFRLENDSDAELVLEHARGSCSCFRRLEIDDSIAPGATSEVRLVFDGIAIGLGPVRHKIRAYFTDGRVLELDVFANLAPLPQPDRIEWFPKRVTRDALQSEEGARLTFFLPTDSSVRLGRDAGAYDFEFSGDAPRTNGATGELVRRDAVLRARPPLNPEERFPQLVVRLRGGREHVLSVKVAPD